MAYNHGREDRKWRIWKEAEEKLLRECGVDEATIEQIRIADRADFNSNRRFYRWTNDIAEYLEDIELLYLKTFSESDVVTYENYEYSTTPDTSVPTPSGGLKVTIAIKDCEQDKNPPSVSAYDRLASVLGIHNGSYLS